jgi:tetratricopeptide (TPR) repeat protein
MKTIRNINLFCLIVTAFLAATFFLSSDAQAMDDAGTRSVFARGAGGRPLALGGAYVAAGNDLSAVIWNPAGLASVQRKGLYATHTDLIGLGFSEQFAVVALPSWRLGTFSLAMQRFAVDGIEGRDDRGAVYDTNLKDAESEFILGYGRGIGPAWRVGAAIKLQQQDLAGYSDAGLGMDLGIQVNPLLAAGRSSNLARALSLGIQFRNVIEPTLRLVDKDLPDPAGIRFGFALDYPLGQNWQALLVSDMEKTKDMDTRLHGGLEIKMMDLLAMRVGAQDGMFTAGTGISWGNFQLDYSFEDNPIETVHRMGFGVAYGPTAEEQRQAVLDREERYLQERLSTAFAQQNDDRLNRLVQSARAALELGQIDRVFMQVGTIRVLAPENQDAIEIEAAAYLQLAKSQEDSGDLAPANLNYSRCLALDPSNQLAIAGMNRVREESNRQTARTSAIRNLFDQAMAAFTADNLIESRDLFDRLLKQNPADPEAIAMLRHVSQTLGIRAESRAERAESLAIAGRLDPARLALAESRKLDPDCPSIPIAEQAIADRAEMDRQAQANIVAARSRNASAALVPTVPQESAAAAPTILTPSYDRLSSERQKEMAELYRKGMLAAQEGRRDNALRYWELVWSEAPDYQQVENHLKNEYLARGMEAFAAGDLDRAIVLWEQTQTIDPDDARARGYLARAQEQQNRIREIRSTQG